MKTKLHVNGKKRTVDVPPMKRLLDTLREDLELTGTKEGCGEGECGACTVLVDGAAVNSCLVPTCQVDGCEVRTVEGVARDDAADKSKGNKGKRDKGKSDKDEAARLHRLQRAFLEHGAAQCGICTPGMLMAALALPKRATLDEIRAGLAGNLCRCTGYMKIYDAVAQFLDGERA
jgi:aerobic-type carbon monoxide dehydrogenase small subunit (CoxS/CutS family)